MNIQDRGKELDQYDQQFNQKEKDIISKLKYDSKDFENKISYNSNHSRKLQEELEKHKEDLAERRLFWQNRK